MTSPVAKRNGLSQLPPSQILGTGVMGAHLGAVATHSHPVQSSERNTQVGVLTNPLSVDITGSASVWKEISSGVL